MTYVALANITLSTSAATVTFSSIPTTGFRDLVLISNMLNTIDTVDGFVAYNGDFNDSNYSRVFMYGDGSSAIGSQAGGQSFVPRAGQGVLQIEIMDYAVTDKHKITLIKSAQAGFLTYNQASRWHNTAAITSIRLNPAAGSFATGATFALYGIRS